ncbi:ergothioneine biosynthesis protein EgtC [Saccharopolyspora cebuensis]|uniref:Gamma-glutamyl-hercynylcysteine sulfoxide hydrolase n=1 Tax=Saccharopolyspora cebuensis TaxID=418759 RepID=A0ABV4CDQ7_9PSEU
MCRHLAYVGPDVPLSDLLLDPAHSLLEQAWAPTDMRGGGTVNVDGFGAGWYAGDGAPRCYRAAVPMWTDEAFRQLAAGTSGGAVLAAVRSATVGMPVSAGACAPFADERWLFSHNGKVPGWPDSLAGTAAELDVVDLMTLAAPTDSAVLWALLRHRIGKGQEPVEAVTGLVGDVLRASPESRLNLLLTDGHRIIATTCTHSLWVRHADDAVAVASEPFGPERDWQPVPDRHLLVADPARLDLTPLQES